MLCISLSTVTNVPHQCKLIPIGEEVKGAYGNSVLPTRFFYKPIKSIFFLMQGVDLMSPQYLKKSGNFHFSSPFSNPILIFCNLYTKLRVSKQQTACGQSAACLLFFCGPWAKDNFYILKWLKKKQKNILWYMKITENPYFHSTAMLICLWIA